jgi:hypothetical protein
MSNVAELVQCQNYTKYTLVLLKHWVMKGLKIGPYKFIALYAPIPKEIQASNQTHDMLNTNVIYRIVLLQ